MPRHGSRTNYYIRDKGEVKTPVFSSCPFHRKGLQAAEAPPQPITDTFNFGWMFQQTHAFDNKDENETRQNLKELAQAMSVRAPDAPPAVVSDIPAGYTYFGQFIAHEITFDKTVGISNGVPVGFRSPQIDLDGLYGKGPAAQPELYSDDSRLKCGKTFLSTQNLAATFPNDLPRAGEGEDPTRALIGDPRNDENLAVAQLHVAFIKFHNEVVNTLEQAGCAASKLFDCASQEVIRHFQWLVIDDYLPRIVPPNILSDALAAMPVWCRDLSDSELFMPLEFSAAAFRFGHSMVRNSYDWNSYHTKAPPVASAARLVDMFDNTAFSGNLGGHPALISDWVIDWRRFFDFRNVSGVHPLPEAQFNHSRRIDTCFDLRLDVGSQFPHEGFADDERSITARNLLRGFALGLPTGEEMADCLRLPKLTAEQVITGPHKKYLDPHFRGRTPLWYYVLKEAELNTKLNNTSRLGPVGGRIIADTLVGLIRHSKNSVLDDPNWQPKFGRLDPLTQKTRFEMVDLLSFAKVVDPIGTHQGYN